MCGAGRGGRAEEEKKDYRGPRDRTLEPNCLLQQAVRATERGRQLHAGSAADTRGGEKSQKKAATPSHSPMFPAASVTAAER